MEKWLNVYETENPLLAILKRTNLKGITLAKFLKEIEIWERDGQGNPVMDSGKQKKTKLIGQVTIRKISNQPIIELENGTSTVELSSSKEEDKNIQVQEGIPKSLMTMLHTLEKTEVSVDMGHIVGIGGQATIIGKGIELEGKNGKEKIDVCLKFEEYGKEEREKTEKEKKERGDYRTKGVKVNGQWMKTGRVHGRGYLRHLMKSTEFFCVSKVDHPNVIKMLDFGITKTIFGDYFFCLG